MKPTDFAKHLSDFFGKYLPGERGLSKNSIMAYRDTFILLIRYYRDEAGIPVSKLTLDKITQTSVSDFLRWLQDTKNCCVRTRNARLAAIKSFFSYLEYENPTYIFESQKIRSIPLKKAEKKSIRYLTVEGIKLLLQQPNRTSKQGRRDFALLASCMTPEPEYRKSQILGLKTFVVHPLIPLRLQEKDRKQGLYRC